MKLPVLAASLVMGLACTGCTATAPGPETSAEPQALCKPEALATFTGQPASAETGAKILAASGARTLRWAGPGMAVTMDYRPDRVTVSYDRAMVIERASCG